MAYRGPGDPEELARTFDWKELLDLFEEVGGSAEAAALFQRHVVSEAESADFDARDGRPRALRRAARGGRGVGGADLGPTRHGGLAVRLRRGADDRRHGRARHQGRAPRRRRRPRGVRGPRPRGQLRAGDRSVRSGRARRTTRRRGRGGAARRGGGRGRRRRPARGGRSALLRASRTTSTAAQDAFEAGDYAAVEEGAAEVEAAMDGRRDGRRAPRARRARRWSSSPSAAGSSFVAGGARRPGRPNRATTRRWRPKRCYKPMALSASAARPMATARLGCDASKRVTSSRRSSTTPSGSSSPRRRSTSPARRAMLFLVVRAVL